MNSVNLIGRLTKDPLIFSYGKSKNSSIVARYTLAVDNPKGEANFITCVCFKKTAEFAEQYLFKGMKVGVSGSIQTSSYNKDGETVYTTDVLVNSHTFCEKTRR